MDLNQIAIVAFAVTAMADALTSNRAIKAGKREGNPVLVKIIGPTPSLAQLLAVKAVALVALAVALVNGPVPYAGWTVLAVSAGQAYVAVRNYRIV